MVAEKFETIIIIIIDFRSSPFYPTRCNKEIKKTSRGIENSIPPAVINIEKSNIEKKNP